ncbi:MAG TPA: PRD domain-containing protein, partial [Anaerolineales bacterium]|nr:PRD domain-containing protein [Anaerolineales bacterium]
GHPLSVSPRERHQLLLFFLLSAKGPLTRFQLEERLPVSLATVSRDLTCIEPWLAGFRLAVERRPRLGISIRGEEEDRRRALITLVLEADVDGLLLHLALWGRAPSSRDSLLEHPFDAVLVRELTDWGLDVAWRYISRVETGLQRHFSDADHLALSLSWALAVRRVRDGHALGARESVGNPLDSPDLIAVNSAADLLERDTRFHLPMAERQYLSLEVRTSCLQPGRHDATEPVGDNGAGEFAALSRHIAAEIGTRVREELAHPEVLDRLAEHLSRAMDRARHGLLIRNPLLTQVRQAYPELWLAAAEVVEELSSRIGVPIPDEEVGYITMYMGMAHELNLRSGATRRPQVVVVCPTGGVTVWMMVSRLQRRLPEIEIVEVTSVRNLSRLDPNRVEAVISTAHVTCKQIPVITVSPLVREEDVERIRTHFARKAPATMEKVKVGAG